MSDFENLDHYALLGVSRSASLDEIKRAYRREISKYHPDRFVNGTPEEQAYASQRSQRLTEAYRVLGDFAERSAYNRGQASAASGGRMPSESRRQQGPAQPRDHQAELYEQAQRHLAEDRLLQAIGVLRQLQQINPFYRDSAELLATAEARLNRRQEHAPRRASRPLLVAGGLVGGLGLAVLAAWAIGMRGATASRNPSRTSAPAAIVATDLPTRPPEPTFSPPQPTERPATAAPTSLPTSAPASPPTIMPTEPPEAAPSPTPFDFPTVTPTTAPAPVVEGGALLTADDFSQGGWANLHGPGWQVGYQDQRYRISASQGIGTIWSYRAGPAKDVSIGVDMQAAAGEGGLLVRFQDANNYVSVSLNPSRTSFRVEQHEGGAVTPIAGGQSEAIQTGADTTNRLVVQLRGSSMEIVVNGQSLASAEAPGAPDSARYGLLVITTDSAAEVFFDNLELRRLE